jgi:hypothetical protein
LPLENQGEGEYRGMVPAQSITGTEVEYYLMVQDRVGNATYDGTVQDPHTMEIKPRPKAWYQKWWVWGIVGVAVAGGAAAAMAGGSGGGGDSPPPTQTTSVSVTVPPLP